MKKVVIAMIHSTQRHPRSLFSHSMSGERRTKRIAGRRGKLQATYCLWMMKAPTNGPPANPLACQIPIHVMAFALSLR